MLQEELARNGQEGDHLGQVHPSHRSSHADRSSLALFRRANCPQRPTHLQEQNHLNAAGWKLRATLAKVPQFLQNLLRDKRRAHFLFGDGRVGPSVLLVAHFRLPGGAGEGGEGVLQAQHQQRNSQSFSGHLPRDLLLPASAGPTKEIHGEAQSPAIHGGVPVVVVALADMQGSQLRQAGEFGQEGEAILPQHRQLHQIIHSNKEVPEVPVAHRPLLLQQDHGQIAQTANPEP